MPITENRSFRILHLCLLGTLFGSANAAAQNSALELKLSAGAISQSSNDVQIPNNDEGSRFSLNDIAGSGPWPGVRFEGIWNYSERHAIRVLLAPLSYRETTSLAEPIEFAGGSFNTNEPVTGEYRFNSWRLGYRYHLYPRERWDLWVGATLKVRDAEIKLTQAGVSSSDDDLGFVPLLHLAWDYRFDSQWSIAADVDALAGGPGRAIDLGVSLNYQAGHQLRFGIEYRVLEGGADTDDVYNFALFNSALLTAQYKL
ncbi:MAG: autotransporter outer membrane beta-barrel domain-containing protein [Granulosicoccus sp.]